MRNHEMTAIFAKLVAQASYLFSNGERARLGRSERRPRRSHMCLRFTRIGHPHAFCSARGAPNNARGGRAPQRQRDTGRDARATTNYGDFCNI